MNEANEGNVVHDTIRLERRYPARVFAAYEDVTLRTRWGVPSDDEVLQYIESNFRIGGCDAYHCGPKGDPKYAATVWYADIVRDRRIVYSESVRIGEQLLSVALVTWLLEPDGDGTRLLLTDQIASFVGREMIEGSDRGTAAALDNVGALLSEG